MIKKLPVSFLLLLLFACSVPVNDQSAFEQSLATRVSIAQTSTAITTILQTATAITGDHLINPEIIQPTITPSSVPEKPKEKLGSSVWRDTLDSGNNWSLSSSGTISNNTLIKVESGSLIMKRDVASGGKTWWLTYPRPQDFYLEGTFTVDNCSGTDQYGLVFRSVNYTDGFAYYFTISCDGSISLLKWDGNGAINIFNWEKSENIQAGSGKTNTLGVWCEGDAISLYVNDKMVKKVTDSSLPNGGHFGLFMDARETPGFSIRLDEIAYWNIP